MAKSQGSSASSSKRKTYDAVPELAGALRSRIDQIILIWSREVRQITAAARKLPFDQLVDNLPTILSRMAEALNIGDGAGLRGLAAASRAQGIARFHQNYDVRALLSEDRALRHIVIEQTTAALERLMTETEQVALHECIDEMLQHAVVAFVDQQNARVRSGTESELKYLSFLSHDLNNNLGSVTLYLQVLRQRVANRPEFAEDVHTLDQAQQSILNTIGGMGRLLHNERLRKGGGEAQRGPVNLSHVAASVSAPLRPHVEKRGMELAVDVSDDAVVNSDEDLITLVLQNIVGNAIKYSTKGTVLISAERLGAQDGRDNDGGNGDTDGDRGAKGIRRPHEKKSAARNDGDGAEQSRDGAWVLMVSDQGPGIAPEQLDRIFEAFKRGESHGQTGVGLGLAIASQAAKLINAELTVESTVGAGTTFKLILPGGRGGMREPRPRS